MSYSLEPKRLQPWCLTKSALNLDEIFDLADVMGTDISNLYAGYEMSHYIAIDIIMNMMEHK